MLHCLIYGDEGTSLTGVESLCKVLPYYLGASVEIVMADDVIEGKVFKKAQMFVMPGGADRFFQEKLQGQGNQNLKDFVESGGYYLGFCAGAYYACRSLLFRGAEYDVIDTRDLVFFPGRAEGALNHYMHNKPYDLSTHTKTIVPITLEGIPKCVCPVYYHGGPAFISQGDTRQDFRVLGYFPQGERAIVSGSVKHGKYFLSSVHFELEASIYASHIYRDESPLLDLMGERQIIEQLEAMDTRPFWNILKESLCCLNV